MYRTYISCRNSSTRAGMRRILKVLPPMDQYIRQAVEAGTYSKPPPGQGRGGRGRRGSPQTRSIEDYPIEYQILTLHPPLPNPTSVPKKLANLVEENEQAAAGSSNRYDPLVKSYLKRNSTMGAAANLAPQTAASTQATEEDYYQKLLGIPKPKPSSFMGQKSTLLNKAYAFAVKQHEILRQNDGMTEEESLEIVEQLLAQDNTSERQTSRQIQKDIVAAMSSSDGQTKEDGKTAAAGTATTVTKDTKKEEAAPTAASKTLESTIPSVLHHKPRTIQGMTLWSKRLQAVPYKEWTVGASVALDHWIARNILELSEETWEELLSGDNPELTSRGKDILIVRHSLFPETNVSSTPSSWIDDIQQDQDTFDSISLGKDKPEEEEESEDVVAEQSIDELLASLGGGLDDDETNKFWKDSEDDNTGAKDYDAAHDDDLYAQLVDELQEWRSENVEKPYDEWSQERKDDFEVWMDRYVSAVVRETDEMVDLDATRTALLSGPPTTREENESLFAHVRDEAQAEIFLQSLKPPSDLAATSGEEGVDAKKMEAYQAFWTLPYTTKLERLVQFGTLRPLWDDYVSESDRTKFLVRHSDKLLEGVELEHLVPDPHGHIRGEDIPEGMATEQGFDKDQTYDIKMIPYGTDEFGTAQSEKARLLYQAWNAHKTNRAQYEEKMFKQGKLGLRYKKKNT